MKILKVVTVTGFVIASFSTPTFARTLTDNVLKRAISCMPKLGLTRVSKSVYDHTKSTIFIYTIFNDAQGRKHLMFDSSHNSEAEACAGL